MVLEEYRMISGFRHKVLANPKEVFLFWWGVICFSRIVCFSWGNRRERDHWGDLGVDGWIILGWISRR